MVGKIGILGGVGPEATADLFKKIIRVTPAKKDQDHIETIIISNPNIPDRTCAILENGEDPIPEMLKTAKTLEAIGASCILIPCNTAHYFYNQLQEQLSIPIINMVHETAKFIKVNYPDVRRVGLLATTGTIQSKIYAFELAKYDIEVIVPEKDIQENFVMESIYGTRGIKAGFKKKPRTLLKYAALHLQEKGAEVIIQGCTEIPLVLTKSHCDQPHVDPTRILAMRAVDLVKDSTLVVSSDALLKVKSFSRAN